MKRKASVAISMFFLLVTALGWSMSKNHRGGIYYFRYFTHVEPQNYFMNAIEINDGNLLIRRSHSVCMTEEKKASGTSSNTWEDMAMERKGGDLPTTLSKVYFRSSTPIRYVGESDGFWEHLGFKSNWMLGYKNWTWSHTITIPFWSLLTAFLIYPLILGLQALVKAGKTRSP